MMKSGTYTLSVFQMQRYYQSKDGSVTSNAYWFNDPVNIWSYDVDVTIVANDNNTYSVSYVDSNGTPVSFTSKIFGAGNNGYASNDGQSIILASTETSSYNNMPIYFYLTAYPKDVITSNNKQFLQQQDPRGGVTEGTRWGPNKLTGGSSSTFEWISTNAMLSDSALKQAEVPCFLPGTLISTPKGDVLVEELKNGDDIFVFSNDGKKKIDKITWIGKSHTKIKISPYKDEAKYPVKILKDAISEGVPFKDLLITSEHCLFFDGKFIPSRMLVNGSSIFYDTSFASYDYYHIETQKHSVIMSNGMMTESYLDTGNRNAFQQESKIFLLSASENNKKTWEKDAAAPLNTSRDIVEPIFNRIKERSKIIEAPFNSDIQDVSYDANIYIRTNDRKNIFSTRVNDKKIIFILQKNVKYIDIISNVSRPADAIGPFVDDRRKLGVLISKISLLTKGTEIEICEHLNNEELSGWHNLESNSVRWTNGEARVNFDKYINENEFNILSITLEKAGPYIIENNNIQKIQA